MAVVWVVVVVLAFLLLIFDKRGITTAQGLHVVEIALIIIAVAAALSSRINQGFESTVRIIVEAELALLGVDYELQLALTAVIEVDRSAAGRA